MGDELEPTKGRRRGKREAKWKKLDIRIEMEGSPHRERRARRGRSGRGGRRKRRGGEAADDGLGSFLVPPDPDTPEGYAYMVRCAVSQLEYLFSVANLAADFFLRSYLDANGALPLAFMCNSYRIGFGVDYHDLLDGVEANSQTLVLDRVHETVRLAEAPTMWLLPHADGSFGCEPYSVSPVEEPRELHPMHRIQEQCVTLKIDMRPNG